MTTWGSPIQIDGVRPEWLADSDRFQWSPTPNGGFDTRVWTDGLRDGIGAKAWPATSPNWKYAKTIRLPVDHFAYIAIDAGFEPWGGGETAPDDWDGGFVLLRSGETWTLECEWQHDEEPDTDIIGYRKKVTPVQYDRTGQRVEVTGHYCGTACIGAHGTIEARLDSGRYRVRFDATGCCANVFSDHITVREQQATVTVPQMTEDQARDLHATISRASGTSGFRDSTWADCTVAVLRHLGIVAATPTPVDRFLADHPDCDRATAEKYAAWSAEQ